MVVSLAMFVIVHLFFFISALSITAETSITTAIVNFKHANPKGIVRYEATVRYENGIRGNQCSVAASANPLRCRLSGIPEAINFYIVVRACFAGLNNCEPPIDVLSRTKLRGLCLTFFLS